MDTIKTGSITGFVLKFLPGIFDTVFQSFYISFSIVNQAIKTPNGKKFICAVSCYY